MTSGPQPSLQAPLCPGPHASNASQRVQGSKGQVRSLGAPGGLCVLSLLAGAPDRQTDRREAKWVFISSR